MKELYLILGWTGWIWLACAVMFAVGYFKGERDARRRAQEQVKSSNEKQP